MMNQKTVIRGVLFDMDGLMFDTERVSANAWKQAGREHGIEIGEEYLKLIRGGGREAAAEAFLRIYGPSHDYWPIRDRKAEILRSYLSSHKIPVKKGLRELLEYLKREDYRIALATSTVEKYAHSYLARAGVEHYFDALVYGDMVEKPKPDPEIFLKAAQAVGCGPQECMVLEDSINGILAASDGGMIPVMVPDMTEPDAILSGRMAARCVDLLQVIEFLERRKAEAGKVDRNDGNRIYVPGERE